MGDVLEFLVDSMSGIAPGGVDGKAVVAGVCSRGQVGKGYLVGKRSDLASLLGSGPLVDRVRDILATGGQEPVLIAVPVRGRPGSYVSKPLALGSNTRAACVGHAAMNADILARVAVPGPLGTARLAISLDAGESFGPEVPAAEYVPLGESGASLRFAKDALLEEDGAWRVITRLPIGPVSVVGNANAPVPTLEEAPAVLAGADLVIEIIAKGGLNGGTYRLSVDGGDNFMRARTIPVDGRVELAEYGVRIIFPEGEYLPGTVYSCRLLAPVPGIVDVMSALETPLSVYDVEFVHVAGPSDSVDWAAAAARAEELWNAHRPTYFKMETRLPYDGEDVHDFAASLIEERKNFAARFVQVCCQFGEISEAGGGRSLCNWAGLQSGRVMSIPVQRATGRIKDGPISQGSLPRGWEAVQPLLEDAGYITAKKYAGLRGAYWGDSRTMAEDVSDYRYEEVLRVTFKAVRKMRIAALKALYDEMEDPLLPHTGGGLAYLKAEIENALGTMTGARPKELAGYLVDIPPNQDVANNGVVVEPTLIGLPIIRQLKLYARYVYAGGAFDPRLHPGV